MTRFCRGFCVRERCGQRLILRSDLLRRGVKVDVRACGQLCAAAYAVETGVDEEGIGNIRVADRVRGSKFRAAVLALGGGNADELRAVFA